MYAYFDIGGTKTRVALGDGIAFEEPLKFDTPQSFEEGITTIVAAVERLRQGRELSAAGGGIAGPLNEARTALVHAPNLKEWVGKPLVAELASRLALPHVYFENDAAIVGLGEAHHGSGVGSRIMAYITVSTGVGGVRIVDGAIDRSTFGFEPGHQILDLDHTVFPVLGAQEAEEMLSGTATAARFHKKAYEVTDPAVWEELAQLLAYMLNNTIVHWSPDTVVLGGSMMVGNPAIPLERVAFHLNQVLDIFPEKPRLVRASLADVGGLFGAMTYVRQRREH